MKKIYSLFVEHPSSVNESYIEHLVNAMRISFALIKLSITAFIHAIFPFYYIHNTSLKLEDLNKLTRNRREKALKKNIDIKDPRFIRDPLYDFGSIIIESKEKGIIYKNEFLTEEKDIECSRILWMKTIEDGYYLLLPPDPIKSKEETLKDDIRAYYQALADKNLFKKQMLTE